MPDIVITPTRSLSTGIPNINFVGASGSGISLQVLQDGSLSFMGTQGTLFSISDSLSGSLMAVTDIAGLPILEVFSDDRVVAGAYNTNALFVSGSGVAFGVNFVPNNRAVLISGDTQYIGHIYSGNTNIADIYYPRSNPSGFITGLAGTGSLASIAQLNSLSGFTVNIVSGGLENRIIQTGNSAIAHANSIGSTISGNLTQTGSTLFNRDASISGGLEARIIATGNSAVTHANSVGSVISGNLTQTGVALLSIIANTGQQAWNAANNNAINLSGNAAATGVALIARDLAISGALQALITEANSDVNSINGQSGTLVITGAGIVSVISGGVGLITISGDTSISGFVTSVSGGLEARITATGAAVIAHANGIGTILSGNLTNTGATLFNRDAAISGGLEARITATGNAAVTHANSIGTTISGNLTQTGVLLGSKMNALSGWTDQIFVHRTGEELISGAKWFQPIFIQTGFDVNVGRNTVIGFAGSSGVYFGINTINKPALSTGSDLVVGNENLFFYTPGTSASFGGIAMVGRRNAINATGILGSNTIQIFGTSNSANIRSGLGANSTVLIQGHSNTFEAVTGATDSVAAMRNGVSCQLGANNAVLLTEQTRNDANNSIVQVGRANTFENYAVNTQSFLAVTQIGRNNLTRYESGSQGVLNSDTFSVGASNTILGKTGTSVGNVFLFGNNNSFAPISGQLSQSLFVAGMNNFVSGNGGAPGARLTILGQGIATQDSTGVIVGIGNSQFKIISGSGLFTSHTGTWARSGLASVEQLISVSGGLTAATQTIFNSLSGWTDTFFVHRTGEELISGNKTFAGNTIFISGQYEYQKTVTANYTVLPTDLRLYCNNTAPITLTLPSISLTVPSGMVLKVKLLNTGSVLLTGGYFANVIDDSASYIIVGQYSSREIHAYGGQNWYVW